MRGTKTIFDSSLLHSKLVNGCEKRHGFLMVLHDLLARFTCQPLAHPQPVYNLLNPCPSPIYLILFLNVGLLCLQQHGMDQLGGFGPVLWSWLLMISGRLLFRGGVGIIVEEVFSADVVVIVVITITIEISLVTNIIILTAHLLLHIDLRRFSCHDRDLRRSSDSCLHLIDGIRKVVIV